MIRPAFPPHEVAPAAISEERYERVREILAKRGVTIEWGTRFTGEDNAFSHRWVLHGRVRYPIYDVIFNRSNYDVANSVLRVVLG